MEWYHYALLGLIVYMIVRILLIRYLVRAHQRRQFYQYYFDVLHLPEYKVKRSSEE